MLKPFVVHEGLVMPLDRPNVDTDAIIPKQYLKSIKRTGFGEYLFDDWRYLDQGDLDTELSSRRQNPDFVLNQSRYAGASVLLARDNFGCGSSREHAVWALENYGFRVVIAPSYADIFFNNSFKNGVLPIVLDAEVVDSLFTACAAQAGYRLEIDLPAQEIRRPDGEPIGFDIDPARKAPLVAGLDEIGLTLQHAEKIKAYELRRRAEAPWLFQKNAA